MKPILVALLFLTSLQLFAFERDHAERLLDSRQISLINLEQQGNQLLLGEVTGAGRALNAEQIEIIFLHDQVILKKEIEAISFKKKGKLLSDLDSFRAHGLYYTAEDIQAVLILKK